MSGGWICTETAACPNCAGGILRWTRVIDNISKFRCGVCGYIKSQQIAQSADDMKGGSPVYYCEKCNTDVQDTATITFPFDSRLRHKVCKELLVVREANGNIYQLGVSQSDVTDEEPGTDGMATLFAHTNGKCGAALVTFAILPEQESALYKAGDYVFILKKVTPPTHISLFEYLLSQVKRTKPLRKRVQRLEKVAGLFRLELELEKEGYRYLDGPFPITFKRLNDRAQH